MKNPDVFVEIKDLKKHYSMGETTVKALDGVSLEIPPGSFTVIMGPSGSGKSTLLYLVGGLDWPTSGGIRVADDEIEKMDENSLAEFRRNRVGFIFQSFNLVSTMIAAENVGFPLRFGRVSGNERKERSLKILDQVGLSDRATHKPTELSGGQQQRVAIARALVNNPPLILADEPTGNLDSATSEDIIDSLIALKQARNLTLIMVTHDPEVAAHADRILQLKDGHLIAGNGNKQ